MSFYIYYFFDRIAGDAGKLAIYSGRRTVQPKDLELAVLLWFRPGELAKHAVPSHNPLLATWHE